MYPSREEFTELIYYISELKHQYTHKIDEQSTKINDQSNVIEELLWQIRELSDKVRQLNQKVIDMNKVMTEGERRSLEHQKSCICRYENHIPRNRLINSRQSVRKSVNAVIKSDKTDDDIYETIEYSDSSSVLYTEPIKADYGALRRVNGRAASTGKQMGTKTMGMKKTVGMRNLKKFGGLQDISRSSDDEQTDPNVELRVKPFKTIPSNENRRSNRPFCTMISDIEAQFIRDTESIHQPRDVSGILINFDCLNSKFESDTNERVSL